MDQRSMEINTTKNDPAHSFSIMNFDDFDDDFSSLNDSSLDEFLSDFGNRISLGQNRRRISTSCVVGFCLASIFLNVYVIITLLWNRKTAFKNIFYLLVLHCAIVDLIRAVSLILWFLPEMDLIEMDTDTLYEFMRVKQYLVIEMRSLNMLTIFNLFIFTFNEFVVVKKPLQYRRIVRRRLILALIVFSWMACFLFGMCSVLTRNYTSLSPMIRRNMSWDESNSTYTYITRRPSGDAEESLQYLFIFGVIVVCVVCMLMVFTCYALIMLRVRRFNRFDSIKSLSSDCQAGGRFRGSVSSHTVDKRKRIQVVVRHKYLLVIGLVLLVDIMFLIPYSFIQVMQYLYMSNADFENSIFGTFWFNSRWISQLLIALHTVLQPACYFRMEEFRRLAACRKVTVTKGLGWPDRVMVNRATDYDYHLAAMTEDDEEIFMMSVSPQNQSLALTNSTPL